MELVMRKLTIGAILWDSSFSTIYVHKHSLTHSIHSQTHMNAIKTLTGRKAKENNFFLSMARP